MQDLQLHSRIHPLWDTPQSAWDELPTPEDEARTLILFGHAGRERLERRLCRCFSGRIFFSRKEGNENAGSS